MVSTTWKDAPGATPCNRNRFLGKSQLQCRTEDVILECLDRCKRINRTEDRGAGRANDINALSELCCSKEWLHSLDQKLILSIY